MGLPLLEIVLVSFRLYYIQIRWVGEIMVRKTKDEIPKTTAQQLGSLIKSARDIMRKDKGLNGDLDRLPMLTWIMFLKFLDDMERKSGGYFRISQRISRPLRPRCYFFN